MIWRLEINFPCPSQNTTDRTHWTGRRDIKTTWRWAMMSERNRLNVPRAIGKRRLTIEYHGPKQMDAANVHGGTKGIVDNLKAMGLIVDDSPSWMENGTPIWIKTKMKAPRKTVLILRDVEPTADPERSEADRKAWEAAGVIHRTPEQQEARRAEIASAMLRAAQKGA